MPNDVDVNSIALTYRDFSREASTMSVGVQSLADNAAFGTALSDLETAIGAVTNGTLADRNQSLPERVSNAAGGTGSSREYKLLIRYEDDTTKKIYTATIPTFDISTVTMITDTDFVDMSTGPAATLKTNFEAIAASPAGNTVTVLQMVSVGRNL
jgi:hypothetical protein